MNIIEAVESLKQGKAIQRSGWGNAKGDSISRMYYDALSRRYHFKLTDPIKDIPPEAIDALMYGTKGEPLQLRYEKNEGFGVIRREFEGIANNLERRYKETQSPAMRAELEECMSETPCPDCGGRRLKKTALAVTVGGMNIAEFTDLPVVSALKFIDSLQLSEKDMMIAERILKDFMRATWPWWSAPHTSMALAKPRVASLL